MLRKIRIVVAVIFFLCLMALFLDLTGSLKVWLGWMAKIQFLPAVLALNVGIILLLVLLTLLLGRVYCSVICPLGVMQDILSRLRGSRKKTLFRFSYSPAKNVWRYTMLIIFVGAMLCGLSFAVALLAPYSSFGRIVTQLFKPLYIWGNNLLASVAEHYDSYAFYHVDAWSASWPVLAVAAVTFVMLFVLAWRNGRTYCNTICPVGTVLGFLARFSFLTIKIDKEKCVKCGLCSRRCKAACIDGKNHKVDSSRCVACMDCIGVCKESAVSFGRRDYRSLKGAAENRSRGEVDGARRTLLTTGTLIVASAALQAQKKKVDGGLAVIEDKKIPLRHTRIVPPGAVSLDNLAAHCTACQLCISSCPNGVLRPSSDLSTLMQPESSYENGYCRPECTACSNVCPTGAILPLDKAQKASTQIGHAVWVKENCVAVTDGVACGNCQRHCPAGAVTMVPLDENDMKSPLVPAVNEARCIGCGACENLCPARPFSAIYVEGHERHRTI